MTPKSIYLWLLLCCACGIEVAVYAQPSPGWHYLPQGTDLVKVKGSHRYNRALYGGNSGFRVEAGDLPRFALYMPGMGGHLHFGLNMNGHTLPMEELDSTRVMYRPGAMHYTFRDSLLQNGTISFQVMALYEGEGLLLRIGNEGIPAGSTLIMTFGGAPGKRFSRDGDIGADPESSFDLVPGYCNNNDYRIQRHTFSLRFPVKREVKELYGILPEQSKLELQHFSAEQPYLKATIKLTPGEACFLLIGNTANVPQREPGELPALFTATENARRQLAQRVQLHTPDSFLNTLGGILAVAADAIYEPPGYLHGAVAWRMRLNAWRGAYAADPLGWHDRARSHFSSYALSQVTGLPPGPVVADTALGMARQQEKMGTAMFSDGYICRNPGGDIRPHHYDMNLVFIDQLLNHFQWTGDTAFVREMWPLIKRHLAWEKRNFDADDDGLYDAYACIWASDALQYNGGAVTHASAYNYKANRTAAALAALLQEDPSPYKAEAEKIHNAIRLALWLPHLGSYAEYRDNIGLRRVHPAAGLWTIYHAIDSKVPDAFETFQALQYIDHAIPHIPVAVGGGQEGYLLSTTCWQPYTWSINNVALAENLHTALACWQGGDSRMAFRLWRTALAESMLLGTSPGNFEQLSAYDAVRGELYRDFADPVGIAARSLVEGLFGVDPAALADTLYLRPGFPAGWDHASLSVPDLDFAFMQKDDEATYHISQRWSRAMQLQLKLPCRRVGVRQVLVNGRPVPVRYEKGIGAPLLVIDAGKQGQYDITIHWNRERLSYPVYDSLMQPGRHITLTAGPARIRDIKDPQGLLGAVNNNGRQLRAILQKQEGWGTVFLEMEQQGLSWWQPVTITVAAGEQPEARPVIKDIVPVDISNYFNDRLTQLFNNRYLSPRWPYPTLQLPVQGVGNWCYPKVRPELDDSGLRKAVVHGELSLPGGLRFLTPSDSGKKNIIYTSLWDNYPDSVTIALKGRGRSAALLLCGTTNPMQSHFENGTVSVTYTDGSSSTLALVNPETWWPVEQDYREDGLAFHLRRPPPQRLHLKTGRLYDGFAPETGYTAIKGFTDRAIEGGAATILYLDLDPAKEIQSLQLRTTANEVVIGLMAVSIIH